MSFEEVGAFLLEIGRYQMEGYRRMESESVEVKDDPRHGESVVTEYDRESERRISAFIERTFPGDSFLGEEHGNIRRNPRRYWILDPIDGTTNFTQGVVYWGPTLALVVDGRIEAGWIHMPAVGQMFHARRGEGARLNGDRIRSSSARRYSDLVSVGTTSSLHRRARLTIPAKQRILGSLVVNLAYLATGTFAAITCRTRIWDVAAGILLAKEAGAIIECRPEPDLARLADLEPADAPSFTLMGRANAHLPSIDGFLQLVPENEKVETNL